MASLIPEALNGTLQPAPEGLERLLLMLRQSNLERQTLGDLLIDLARMDQLLDRINKYRSLFEDLHAFRSTVITLVESVFGGSAFKLRQLMHDSGSLGSNGVILHAGSDQLLFVSKPPAPPAPKPEEEFTDDCELVEDEDMEDEDHGDNDGGKRLVPVRQWFLDVRTSRSITYIRTEGNTAACNSYDYRSHQIEKATGGPLFRALYARRTDAIGHRGGRDYVRITKEMAVTFLRALEVNQALPEARDVRNALGLA